MDLVDLLVAGGETEPRDAVLGNRRQLLRHGQETAQSQRDQDARLHQLERPR